MENVSTFDIAHQGIAIDGQLQSSDRRLVGKILGFWDRLQQAGSSAVRRAPDSQPAPLSGYYNGAYDRARASMPVLSFRGLL